MCDAIQIVPEYGRFRWSVRASDGGEMASGYAPTRREAAAAAIAIIEGPVTA